MTLICFGQQPCGFFPKRYLVAKIYTALALQKQIGGQIIFFYHDSDSDYRETITLLHDKLSKKEVRLNFTQENKLQKKYSPLYLKRIPADWKETNLHQFPRFELSKEQVAIFESIESKTAGNFCLEMYHKMGLLKGIEIMKSSDTNFREKALDLKTDYFADVEYQGEIVRARSIDGQLKLHEGGGLYITLPEQPIKKSQKSPARDDRFSWMQSVIHCTHYIYGEGEKNYLKQTEHPEVKFIPREYIDHSSEAWYG